MNISLGRSGFKLAAIASHYNSETASYETHELRAELVLSRSEAKGFYAALEQMKSKLESEMGESFTWHNPEGKNMCRIWVRRNADLSNAAERQNDYAWLIDKLDRMHTVFAPRIKILQPLEGETEDS